MGTRIVACTCKSEYQDARYGPGRRVANVMKDRRARCATCLTVHGGGPRVK